MATLGVLTKLKPRLAQQPWKPCTRKTSAALLVRETSVVRRCCNLILFPKGPVLLQAPYTQQKRRLYSCTHFKTARRDDETERNRRRKLSALILNGEASEGN